MPEYLSPGVYVEEIDAGPKPIEGVSTSTAGAVGVTVRGPTTGKPELVTSFSEFMRKFGGFLPLPPPGDQNRWNGNALEGGRWWQFPLSVKGFFDNGGQRLYVKRVFSRDATPAGVDFPRGLVAEIESDATRDPVNPQPPSFVVRHLFRLQNGSGVSIRNGATGQVAAGFQIASYDPQTRRVTLDVPLQVGTDVRAARGDVLVIAAPAAAAANPLHVDAISRGVWGRQLRVRARPMVGASLALLPAPPAPGAANPAATARIQQVTAPAAGAPPGTPWTVTVQNAGAGNPAALTDFGNNDRVTINGIEYVLAGVNAPNDTFTVVLPAAPTWPPGTTVQRLRTTALPQNDQLRLWGAGQLYLGAVVELDNGRQKEELQVNGVQGDVVTFSAQVNNTYHEGHRLRVVELELTVQYRPGTGPNAPVEAEETFGNLRMVGPAGDPSYVVTRVNAASKLIRLADAGVLQPVATNALPAVNGRWLDLAGGDDALATLDVDAFVGEDGGSGNRTGIQALEDIDEISICMAPGMWSRSIHNAIIQHCEILKDRFAIIDPPDDLSIEEIRGFREVYDTKYAALYYPWIEVRDPLARQNFDVAPSGHIAGIYARVDNERGVHKAPANEVIRGINRISQDVTKREQDMLNPRNINVLRYFPNRGNRVWGARCVTSDSAWKYINVRRLFIYVEESIDEGTQWVVFEPNDEPTWARVRQSITNFLISTWRSGALQGAKAEEAFFVRCDRTTMTQDDIDNGKLICVIGIAPVKPAEFVIFRIQQKTLDNQTSA